MVLVASQALVELRVVFWNKNPKGLWGRVKKHVFQRLVSPDQNSTSLLQVISSSRSDILDTHFIFWASRIGLLLPFLMLSLITF